MSYRPADNSNHKPGTPEHDEDMKKLDVVQGMVGGVMDAEYKNTKDAHVRRVTRGVLGRLNVQGTQPDVLAEMETFEEDMAREDNMTREDDPPETTFTSSSWISWDTISNYMDEIYSNAQGLKNQAGWVEEAGVGTSFPQLHIATPQLHIATEDEIRRFT